ncbi:unnamed protein product [Pelagomonas calceolata]|uniref:polyribonucleotide nucleotidyltransferase n=2 Tax=Pelagomonas calceolata TaxID=35677 RepID=A0A8J2SHL9_9STRA|nr:unnamed protein product [Pelagomonas calceolata]
MRLLLLLAASQALQPRRHTRPRTRLQVAVLPDAPHSIEIPIGDGAPLILETGRIGRQADAAVVAKRGGTTVYATLCVGDADAGGGDFLPMSIDYQERYSATGRTSGAYNKRDGRASDGEILTCRLIDRPLRPSVVDGFCGDVQVLAWVLSYDGIHEAQTLAVQACSAALQLSSVPTLTSVGCARCTLSDDTLTTSPSVTEAASSTFDIIVGAGSDGSVLMVEAEGSFAPEAQALAALNEAVDEAQRIGHAIGAWASALKKDVSDGLRPYPSELESIVEDAYGDAIREQTKALRQGDMASSRKAYGDLCQKVDGLSLEKDYTRADSSRVLKKLSSRAMCALVRSEGLRSDGRDLTTVRPIDIDMAPLPTAHGSVVFTRGETQSLATCTLGDQSMQLRVDDALEPNTEKRFYLQYAFPPSSVGETGRTGAPGRREVGHGALAEKALRYALPDAKTFPYSMRVESLITESCGSSSMASVCGGCLALLDAGVPLTTSVAGVAMGVLLDDVDDPVVLTDILGIEDALGGMDFKVAGSRDGISAFQLDVKELGLKAATLEKALAQAREARLHVLDEMASRGVDEPQALSDSVPKTKTLQVEPAKIGKIIGKGGETIRGLIADYCLANVDVDDEGAVMISGNDPEQMEACAAKIVELTSEATGGGGRKQRAAYDGPMPEVGSVYASEVVSIKTFGAFVSFGEAFPGLEGLCHISELAPDRVRNIEKFISVGDAFDVKVLAIDEDSGKLKLSRKAALADKVRDSR